MCGRYALYGPASRHRAGAIEFIDRDLAFTPTYNAAPSQHLPVYRVTADGQRELTRLRWGLVPFWAKDPAIGARLVNARAETVAGKPAFRAAFSRRRCLVPMSGFYEWQRQGARKLPHLVRPLNDQVFAVAGLFERWEGADGGPLETFTVITTAANELMRPLHERMPAILHAADFEAWLAPDNRDAAGLQGLLVPCPAEEMRAWAVGPRVNNVRNDDPGLIEPV